MSDQQLRCIVGYGAIKIDDEGFFEEAFSTGKKVAACPGCAREAGSTAVLEGRASLRATPRGR